MRTIKLILLFSIVTGLSVEGKGQDIRGASLKLQNINWLTYEARLNLYADKSININRPFVIFDWALTTDTLFFVYEVEVEPGILKKEYAGIFTFIGNGYYNLNYTDTFRVAGIDNLSNSETDSIRLDAELIISPFGDPNNSPIIFTQQNTIIENNGTYTYNPNVWDPNGDSLHFELIPCYGSGYSYANNTYVDSLTGVLTTTPNVIGFYSYCVKVEEWNTTGNQPLFVGSTTYDIAIDVNTTIGINEQSTISNEQITIYPNPAQSELYIKSNFDVPATFELHDLTGRKVLSQTITSNQPINISYLAKGLYVWQIKTPAVSARGKIIKQ